MNIFIYMQFMVGLLMSLLYPKLVKAQLKDLGFWCVISICIILGIVLNGLIMLFFVFLLALDIVASKRYLIDNNIKDWKVSISIFTIFILTTMIQIKIISIQIPFILPIVLIILTIWLSNEKKIKRYFDVISIICLGNIFLHGISNVFLSIIKKIMIKCF